MRYDDIPRLKEIVNVPFLYKFVKFLTGKIYINLPSAFLMKLMFGM